MVCVSSFDNPRETAGHDPKCTCIACRIKQNALPMPDKQTGREESREQAYRGLPGTIRRRSNLKQSRGGSRF